MPVLRPEKNSNEKQELTEASLFLKEMLTWFNENKLPDKNRQPLENKAMIEIEYAVKLVNVAVKALVLGEAGVAEIWKTRGDLSVEGMDIRKMTEILETAKENIDKKLETASDTVAPKISSIMAAISNHVGEYHSIVKGVLQVLGELPDDTKHDRGKEKKSDGTLFGTNLSFDRIPQTITNIKKSFEKHWKEGEKMKILFLVSSHLPLALFTRNFTKIGYRDSFEKEEYNNRPNGIPVAQGVEVTEKGDCANYDGRSTISDPCITVSTQEELEALISSPFWKELAPMLNNRVSRHVRMLVTMDEKFYGQDI